jgi:DNA-binding GntR family transcriptional regulator
MDHPALEPSYLQLAAKLREGIKSGEFASRDLLPSINALTQRPGCRWARPARRSAC